MRRLIAGLIVVWLGVGCGMLPTPSSPAPSTTLPARSPAPSPSSAALPSTPEPTPRRGATALDLDFQIIDPRFTTPLLATATTGTEIIWSTDAVNRESRETAPDLYRFRPGVDAEPALIWQNPRREAVLEPIVGDGGRYAFGERGTAPGDFWRFWLLPAANETAVLLDDGDDGEDVPGFIPSFDLDEDRIVWTAFHAGPNGPESQLWQASAPDWTPSLVRSVLAAERELWLPSLRGSRVAFVEVIYAADHSTDERHVLLGDLDDPASEPIGLDQSGRATMPVLLDDAVIWKETPPGFNMFSWGSLRIHSLTTGETRGLSMLPQPDVNYPSAGNRFVAAWGSDSFAFAIHDLERAASRHLLRYALPGPDGIFRPHVAGDMVIALHSTVNPDGTQIKPLEIWWAWLPKAGEDR
ncbi:MAG: hypothetical protein ACRDGJ_11625 [Candidatus Limnocylindria bacterium]